MIYEVIGGSIPIFLLSLLFGKFLFQNFEIKKKLILSITVSFLVISILSGFGGMDGGNYNPSILRYFLSSLIVLVLWFGWIFLKKPKVNKD